MAEGKIFIINPKGEIVPHSKSRALQSSYSSMNEILEMMFPATTTTIDSTAADGSATRLGLSESRRRYGAPSEAGETFNTFNFWRQNSIEEILDSDDEEGGVESGGGD